MTLESELDVIEYLQAKYSEELGENGTITLAPSGEVIVSGHRAWKYNSNAFLQPRMIFQRWVLDTGELFITTGKEDENTPEKGLQKMRLSSMQQ